jgi:hypothetical protein
MRRATKTALFICAAFCLAALSACPDQGDDGGQDPGTTSEESAETTGSTSEE